VLNTDGDAEKEEAKKPLTDGEKAKALYRRALARVAGKDDKEAIVDLEAAQKLQPDDAAIKQACVLLSFYSASLY
jgi:peptidyl-prolyl isomerase D